MENISYDTVTEAVKGLKKEDSRLDFNLQENCLVCNDDIFNVDDFEIMEVYRFEGDSDPSDEAVVYGNRIKEWIERVLVNGYGISAEAMSVKWRRN